MRDGSMGLGAGRMRLILTLSLLASLVLCLFLSWSTRETIAATPFPKMQVVDQSPWQTAQALTALAETREETELAQEAEHLADHEVDQAFASALRRASLQHRALNGETLALTKKITQLQQIVKADHARVQSLSIKADAADDLDLAKAQLGLDSDEIADAQQDLARAGGDERSRIQQELTAHEAAMRDYDARAGNKSQAAVASVQQSDNLALHLKAWINQRTRYQLTQAAMHRAEASAIELTAQHKELESRGSAVAANLASDPVRDKPAALATLKERTARSQLLGIYDDRIQSQQQLAAVYRQWSAQLQLQHRALLHRLLQSFAVIAFILICVILGDVLVRHVVERPTFDERRMHTLRVIFKLGIHLVGVLLILLVIFGAPSQTPTILGLTTAGLTVVLQDFIIAFFGWFVLMGKNGIRIGDWVEINGVGGEVVEIGIFRTAMNETGNWTDKGHATGRRVTFINSFAIKGQYFNFSTTGQWMWDEITLSIPACEDTYDIIEQIHKAVLKETEKDTRIAEQEWKRVTPRNGLSQFTAGPAVNLRPGATGIDIIVRYVTRASDRFEVRNRLYQCVVGLLHKPLTPQPQPDQLQALLIA